MFGNENRDEDIQAARLPREFYPPTDNPALHDHVSRSPNGGPKNKRKQVYKQRC